jgi:hypothetical protein
MVSLLASTRTSPKSSAWPAAPAVTRFGRSLPKRQVKRIWMLVGVAAGLSLVGMAPARATTTVIRSTIAFSSFACPAPGQENGEPVNGSGQCVTVATVTSNPNGGFHAHLEFQCQGTAVGAETGTKFTFSQAGTFDFDTTPSTSTTGTQVSTFQLISQGSAPNQRVRFTFHATIAPDGTVTVSFSDFTVVCG